MRRLAIVEDAPAPRFGEAGEVVFSGDSSLGVASTKFDRSDASDFNVSLSPGLDLTLVHEETTSFGAGPRHERDFDVRPEPPCNEDEHGPLPLAVRARTLPCGAAFLRRLRPTIAHTLSAPLLVHVAPHVFVGFGPSVARELVREVPGTVEKNLGARIGAGLLVGGWL